MTYVEQCIEVAIAALEAEDPQLPIEDVAKHVPILAARLRDVVEEYLETLRSGDGAAPPEGD